MGNLLNHSPDEGVIREDKYRTVPDTEPMNCNGLGDISKANQREAEEAARLYYHDNSKQKCCTISGGVVTKYLLPSPSSPSNKVQLRAKPGVHYVLLPYGP